MSAAVVQLLEEIIERTPTPPPARDAERLLADAEAMLAARRPLLEALSREPPPAPDHQIRALLDTLRQRDRHWTGVLRAARGQIGDRLDGMKRLRREGPKGGATGGGYEV